MRKENDMEYTKIPNIFMRDPKTKKIIEGKYASETLEYLKNCEWEFTEKVDGTNIRVEWDGYRVEFKGRTDKAQIPKHLLEKLESLFGGELNEEIFEQTFGKKHVILFGEGYGEKIQKGGELYGPVDFIMFDVWVDGVWLKRDSMLKIAEKFGVKSVPVVGRGTLDKAVDFVASQPISSLKADVMEGVVGRPATGVLDRIGERIIVKIKCRDFV